MYILVNMHIFDFSIRCAGHYNNCFKMFIYEKYVYKINTQN